MTHTAGTGAGSGPVRIEVIFAAESGFHADWEQKWQRGERPSRWPYGLDKLADYADEVALVYVKRARRWRRMVRPLTDRLLDRAARRRPGRDIGLTWDEQVAIRMVGRRRHAEMYSGAIWIADRVERGEHEYNELMIGALKETDGIWLNSRPHLEPMRAIVGPGPRLQFTTFGIDETFFVPQPLPETPCVLSIGTDRDRDWATLLGAYALVHEEMPEAELLTQIDSGSDVPVPDYVTALPRMEFDELRGVYARASVVATAMRHNLHVSGLTVSLEARATGRPVVTTRTVGMEDFLTDGVDCALVPIGDERALADEILRLLRDRQAAQEMGRAGREQVLDHLTNAALVADLARLMRLEKRETPGRVVVRGIV